MVGYRWFDEEDKPVAFPFGFGLSYTSFSYSDIRVSGSMPNLTVSATITNTGTRSGAEVAQLYVGLPDISENNRQPPRQLKGFQRVDLEPGESATVAFNLDEQSFAYWNEANEQWDLTPGCYGFYVGSHSRDSALTAALPFGSGQCD